MEDKNIQFIKGRKNTDSKYRIRKNPYKYNSHLNLYSCLVIIAFNNIFSILEAACELEWSLNYIKYMHTHICFYICYICICILYTFLQTVKPRALKTYRKMNFVQGILGETEAEEP